MDEKEMLGTVTVVLSTIKEYEDKEEKFFKNLDCSDISKEELINLIYEIIKEDCYYEKDNKLFSKAISAYADAIRLLAKVGLVEIKDEYMRMVIGKLKDKELNKCNLNSVDKSELIRVLYWLVIQDCWWEEKSVGGDELYCESFGDKYLARAMKLLSKVGIFKITYEDGNYIKGFLKRI